MTTALRPFSVSLQYLGLSGSALGLAASYLFVEPCTGFLYIGGGIFAVALDLIALRLSPNATAIAAAASKPVALLLLGSMLIMCAPPVVPEPDRLLPTWTGPALLWFSSVPSVVGAILRRLVR